MCEKCVRRSKRIGLPKGKFGKVKFWANYFAKYRIVPLFCDRRLNVAIEAHLHRILKARTYRPRRSAA